MTPVEVRTRLRQMLEERWRERWPEVARAFWLAWRAMAMPEPDELDTDVALSAMALIVVALWEAERTADGVVEPLTKVKVVA